jgi:hypothetical protein
MVLPPASTQHLTHAGMFQRGQTAVALPLEVVPFLAVQVLRAAVRALINPKIQY